MYSVRKKHYTKTETELHRPPQKRLRADTKKQHAYGPFIILWETSQGEKRWDRALSFANAQQYIAELVTRGVAPHKIIFYPSVKELIRFRDALAGKAKNQKAASLEASPDERPHALYVLERETPEILGSGSDTQEIARTNNLEEALTWYHNGRGNRLTRYSRNNGKLSIQTWDEWEVDFV